MGNYWSEGELPPIPDFTEPVRLYRTFRSKIEPTDYYPDQNIYETTTLRGFYSTSHEYAWGDGEVEAACKGYNSTVSGLHIAPKKTCTCGFYGYHLPTQTTEFAEVSSYLAVIEAWGKVVAHSLGARVQYARIVAVAASHKADEHDRDWLKEHYSDHRIDVGFGEPGEMYEKYPPQDVSAFIGTTAIKAQISYRKKQEQMELAKQLRILQAGHASLTSGDRCRVCRCPGCTTFYTQECKQPGCKVCSGEIVIDDDGYASPAQPGFFINVLNPIDVSIFPKGSFLNP